MDRVRTHRQSRITRACLTWPTYDARTRAVMVFDAKTEVLNDPRASERKVWEGKTLVR